jgi:hypothetical protein
VKTKIYHQTSSLPDNIGPAKYEVQTAMGPQWESRKKNPVTFKFAQAKIPGREDDKTVVPTVGHKPWFYDAIGPQFDSRKKNAIITGFPNGTRGQRDRTAVCYTGLDAAAVKCDVRDLFRVPTLPDQKTVLKYSS